MKGFSVNEGRERFKEGIERRRESAASTPALITCATAQYLPISNQDLAYVHRQFSSLFAYVVQSTVTSKDYERVTDEIEDRRNRLLSWLLREPTDGRQLALRYVADPDRGSITIAIICKCNGNSQEESERRAKSMMPNLSLILKEFSAYAFRPVTERDQLLEILQPFVPTDVRTIQRQTVPFAINDRTFTAVHPFSFNRNTSLNNLLGMLLKHEVPMMVNISLSPVAVFDELKRLCADVREARTLFEIRNPRGEAFIESGQRGLSVTRRISLGRSRDGNLEQQESGLELLESQIGSLENACLLSRIDVASVLEIPSVFIETLRYDFFGSEGRMEVRSCCEEDLEEVGNGLRFLNLLRPPSNGSLSADLLNLSQAKCVFQLPIPDAEGVRGIAAEHVAVIAVPKKAVEHLSGTDGFLVAEGFSRKGTIPIVLTPQSLTRHVFLAGRSGCGKSTLLLRLALSLAAHGEGLCLIDPHGDVSAELAALLPENRRPDLIYFDPTDSCCKERLNLLENDGSEAQQTAIHQEFMAMLLRLYSGKEHMGPMFERYFKYTLLLAAMAHKTLPDLYRIWSDEPFREGCLERVKDHPRGQEIIHFWKKEKTDGARSDNWAGMETYIVSKIDRFASDETMRRCLSSPSSTIDFDRTMNEGKILIARLPKGLLGEINAYTLGMILSFKLRQATIRRGNIPEADRRSFYLLIDEFHNFVSSGGFGYTHDDDPAFSSFFAEARKFKVSIVAANQHIHQLGAGVRNAIFGNVQSRIIFGVGAEDASYIKTQFAEKIDEAALVSLPDFHAYAQIQVNGQGIGPFTLRTIGPKAEVGQ
ncbi:MAG: AAA-like domain protein [Syntrophorhabdus sp. PtaU1.Bin153]|nr:MAG: AAA-like domain protein [Syntrophorhabdus sp. PtaU1.Bin153]